MLFFGLVFIEEEHFFEYVLVVFALILHISEALNQAEWHLTTKGEVFIGLLQR